METMKTLSDRITYVLYETNDGHWCLRLMKDGKPFGAARYCTRESLQQTFDMLICSQVAVYEEAS